MAICGTTRCTSGTICGLRGWRCACVCVAVYLSPSVYVCGPFSCIRWIIPWSTLIWKQNYSPLRVKLALFKTNWQKWGRSKANARHKLLVHGLSILHLHRHDPFLYYTFNLYLHFNKMVFNVSRIKDGLMFHLTLTEEMHIVLPVWVFP